MVNNGFVQGNRLKCQLKGFELHKLNTGNFNLIHAGIKNLRANTNKHYNVV